MDDRCPACAEPLPDRPARCFRCEADLVAWWRLEAAIGAAAIPEPAVAPGARSGSAFDHWHALLAVLVVVAALLGHLAVPRSVQAPAPALANHPEPEPSPSPSPSPVRTLRYRVQPGDSPWRIAAALTGRGERWPELFPSGTRLRAGAIVELPLPPP